MFDCECNKTLFDSCVCDFFILDGVHSSEMGVNGCHIVYSESADITSPWIGAKGIVTTRLIGHDNPIFVKTTKENLSFVLTFSLLNNSFVPEVKKSLGRVFGKSVPVSFQLSEDLTKVINVVPTNQVDIRHIAGLRGDFAITFQATTPNWLTHSTTKDGAEVIDRLYKSGDVISVNNLSNVQHSDGSYDFYPHLTFTVSSGQATTNIAQIISKVSTNIITKENAEILIDNINRNIANASNGQSFILVHTSNNFFPTRSIIFTGLEVGETIEMDFNLKHIKSSIGKNRFPNWNKEWMWMHGGVRDADNINKYLVIYDSHIIIKSQYPIYQ